MAIGIGFRTRGFVIVMPAIRKPLDRATEKVMKRYGSFVRQTARRSIRKPTKSKPHSSPGEPPRSATGFLKNPKLLIFNYDRRTRSVVVGPVKIFSKRTDAPRVLEEGGTAIGRRRGFKGRKRTVGGFFRFQMKARPYIGPANVENLPKLPGLWKNSVRF